jgi:hypothetical protein
MNFESLNRIIEKNKNRPLEEMNEPTPVVPMDRNETMVVLKKIENKLGQHTNTYKPLITYLSRNKEALALFNDLLEKVGSMNAATASKILSAR